jgi:Uma2 family endonuclease
MNTLKEKIVDKLEIMPEIDLQEILDFVEFLAWRKMNSSKSLSSDEVLNWPQEKEEDELVHYVDGVLVVKSPSKETRINQDLETSVNDVREERLRRLASW